MAATKTRTYERELEVALWWRDFRATNNAHFLPLLFDQHRYLVLKGGGGSGKRIFWKVSFRAFSIGTGIYSCNT